MIFRISGTNVYLVGSIHLVPAGITLSLEKQRALLEEAHEVIFESDLDHMSPPANRFFESGRLSDVIPRPLLERVVSLADEIGFEEPVDTIKPWFTGLVLSIRLQIRSGAVWGGVDRALWDQAKSTHKPMFVLERAEVFEKVDAAPVSEAIAALELVATHPDEPVAQLSRIYEAWRAADQSALDGAFSRMAQLAPTIYRCLFEDRNRLWFPSILKAARTNRRALFVIGCGHIAHGSASIKILLEEAGLSLEVIR
jgi:uncharacterized protein